MILPTTHERPILFSAPMVRAILAGHKTQTRRLVKTYNALKRYGIPGDRLWVRETFVLERWDRSLYDEALGTVENDRPTFHHPGDGTEFDEPYWLRPHYRATDPAPDLYYGDDPNHDDDGEPKCKWIPSIFMPRWASRLTLEIIALRFESLNSITEEDAIQEGMQAPGIPAAVSNVAAYARLWNEINGKSGFTWEKNPSVWVIEFRMI